MLVAFWIGSNQRNKKARGFILCEMLPEMSMKWWVTINFECQVRDDGRFFQSFLLLHHENQQKDTEDSIFGCGQSFNSYHNNNNIFLFIICFYSLFYFCFILFHRLLLKISHLILKGFHTNNDKKYKHEVPKLISTKTLTFFSYVRFSGLLDQQEQRVNFT